MGPLQLSNLEVRGLLRCHSAICGRCNASQQFLLLIGWLRSDADCNCGKQTPPLDRSRPLSELLIVQLDFSLLSFEGGIFLVG